MHCIHTWVRGSMGHLCTSKLFDSGDARIITLVTGAVEKISSKLIVLLKKFLSTRIFNFITRSPDLPL